jgi:hypothetical protein
MNPLLQGGVSSQLVSVNWSLTIPPLTAAKAPKLDSNLVFEQLKGQDTVLSELDKALDDLGKAESEAPKDPRFDGLCKIVRLLATSQKNLTSALVDTVKVKTISAPETAKPPVDKTATQVKGKKPPPSLSNEETAIR